ncbi:carotenoid ester lipase precursor [Polyporus arcularius HHB13444]|uniref:Carboxylic ester hydrolase n=1 Tax=Polyporus arcularius HHB13444 TaxID=1314778 RepID=A0A5C3PBP6_9APHY|nr:carotenoid ester lipase precursor [Polyporus arcularius HHB13444]
MLITTVLNVAALFHVATCAPWTASPVRPSVRLDDATFIGSRENMTEAYLGIKFAEAPRFHLPRPVGHYPTGIRDAGAFGPSCPQHNSVAVRSVVDDPSAGLLATSLKTPWQRGAPTSEDCLNLNVWVPIGTKSMSRLPVVVWIFGGDGTTASSDIYDGGIIVRRSMQLGEPVVYVSMNYRVSAFGFLASKEVKDAGVGNIGLEDQRVALKWIQKYIAAFGGDPTRVTIWGESAGAISVSLHMLFNGGDTEGLFHGAFMQSGAPIPVGDITHGQAEFDALVANTECDLAVDKLECLRLVPYTVLKAAVDKSPGVISYQSLRLSYLPRADGRFLLDAPQKLVLNGSVSKIPFVTGSCDDEGTLFSLFSSFIVWDDAHFRDYVLANYMNGAAESDVGDLFDVQYPDDAVQGSPFDTGSKYAFLQYKRLSAIQGDLVFQAPRRFFLEHTSDERRTWSFLSKRNKDLSLVGYKVGFLGAAHGSDLSNVYGPGDMTDYLIHFVNHGDPNGPEDHLLGWPQYNVQSRHQMTFLDSPSPLIVESDVYRAEAFQRLTELSLEFPL